jgi:hypothetical protein
MINFKEHKFAILSNPRTGTSSIISALKEYRTDVPVHKIINADKKHPLASIDFFDYYGKAKIQTRHQFGNLQYFLDTNVITDYDPNEYKVYVFLRNPVDRFKSICRNIRNDVRSLVTIFDLELHWIITEEDRMLSHTLSPSLQEFSSGFQDVYNSITMDKIARKFLSNSCWITPSQNKIPQKYYYDNRVIPLDYNNLQIEFNSICDKIGIERSLLPVTNQTIESSADTISEETIDLIKLHYAEDVSLYSGLTNPL